MIILTIRTDKPEAELGIYEDQKQISYKTWEAHRHLAETLHIHIRDILTAQGLTLEQIEGIVIYKGPGSFTGLRIGLSVANTLGYSSSIPIVAESDDWIERGINRLLANESDTVAQPEYGQAAHTTTQKK